MGNAADRAVAPLTTAAPSLRRLSRDFSDGRLSFNDYRAARKQLLDDIAMGAAPLNPYQPPLPSLAARVNNPPALSDTQPTIPYRRPRTFGRWKLVVLIVLLAIAVLAGIFS